MLREDEIRIDTGLASHGGDFIRIEHLPTGIERWDPGPLANVDRHQLVQKWLAEIEAELKEKGLTEFIVPAYPKKNRWQGKRQS